MWRGGRGAAAAHPPRLTLSRRPRGRLLSEGSRLLDEVGALSAFCRAVALWRTPGGLCAPRREKCVVKWPRQDGRAIMAAGASQLRAASGQMQRPLAWGSRADEFLLWPLSDGWGPKKREPPERVPPARCGPRASFCSLWSAAPGPFKYSCAL